MIRIPLYLVQLLIILIFCQCTSDEVPKKVITVDLLDTSKLPTRINKIITLDTIEDAIIGGIDRISHLDGKILIYDFRSRSSLVLFDSNGRFTRSLQRGKGANELHTVADFTIYNDRVHILDVAQKKVLIANYDLEVIDERRVDIFGKYFQILAKDKWLFYSQSAGIGGKRGYSFIIYNPDSGRIEDRLLRLRNAELGKVRMGNTISRERQMTIFCRPFDHQFYTYADSGLQVEYQLDFGEHNVSDNDLSQGLQSTYEKMRMGQIVSIDGGLINNEDYLACSFAFAGKLDFLIYCKRTDRTYTSVSSNISLPVGKLVDYHDGSFVLLVTPSNLAQYIDDFPGLADVKLAGRNYSLVYFSLI